MLNRLDEVWSRLRDRAEARHGGGVGGRQDDERCGGENGGQHSQLHDGSPSMGGP
jgi:hypothetical protein